VFKFRSVDSIVIAPASTGADNKSNKAVITTEQTNKGIRSSVIPVDRILITVVIKFTVPKIEETVQPIPAPFSTILLTNKERAGGRNQNLILFIRGNTISGAPNIIGTNKFPNHPIIFGITIKKIIIKACAVTIIL